MSYFKPWRRKIGVGTLVMACVAMAGWVRSELAIDSLTFPVGGNSVVRLSSQPGRFIWFSWKNRQNVLSSEPMGWHSYTRNLEDDPIPSYAEYPFSSRVSKGLSKNTPTKKYWILWYWSIVIPLTLLSAYLLISKPRLAKQAAPPVTTAN